MRRAVTAWVRRINEALERSVHAHLDALNPMNARIQQQDKEIKALAQEIVRLVDHINALQGTVEALRQRVESVASGYEMPAAEQN